MLLKMLDHPVMEILHISDSVEEPTRAKDIGVLGQQSLTNNTGLVLLLLEMRIREQKKHFAELGLVEKVWQKLHGISTDDSDILVVRFGFSIALGLLTKSDDALLDEVGDFDADFHAKGILSRIELSQGD